MNECRDVDYLKAVPIMFQDGKGWNIKFIFLNLYLISIMFWGMIINLMFRNFTLIYGEKSDNMKLY